MKGEIKMKLAKINTDSCSGNLNDTLDRLFTNSYYNSTPYATSWTPLVDIVENEEAYEIIAEIPGMNKNDIQLSLEDNVLKLSGEKQEHFKEGTTCHRHERPAGKFERSFRLPKEVKASEIQAKCENGVLTVKLPKAEEAKPREISIH